MNKIPLSALTVAMALGLSGCIIIPIPKVRDTSKYCTIENAYTVAKETGDALQDICGDVNAESRAVATERGKKYYELSRKIELYQEMLDDPSLDSVLKNAPEPIPDYLLREKIKRLIAERQQYATPPVIVPAS
ncbi:hypothetical protein HJ526_06600 [Donghicola sp. C2-DW-16]|uniref:Lipoprotein n=1 Tax=Donghicola mangrovi TaxID=2729614 RepID=A0A850Q3B1_9RHOB|nr:hypothetical protein [Donghicola mangrovi]NVO23463.1 hypothetical protein [Donghicola mangrovi]NVO27079.1 hypothetical protein [Donghicola mangrovi]